MFGFACFERGFQKTEINTKADLSLSGMLCRKKPLIEFMKENGGFRKYDESVYMDYILSGHACSLVSMIICCFTLSAVKPQRLVEHFIRGKDV